MGEQLKQATKLMWIWWQRVFLGILCWRNNTTVDFSQAKKENHILSTEYGLTGHQVFLFQAETYRTKTRYKNDNISNRL